MKSIITMAFLLAISYSLTQAQEDYFPYRITACNGDSLDPIPPWNFAECCVLATSFLCREPSYKRLGYTRKYPNGEKEFVEVLQPRRGWQPILRLLAWRAAYDTTVWHQGNDTTTRTTYHRHTQGLLWGTYRDSLNRPRYALLFLEHYNDITEPPDYKKIVVGYRDYNTTYEIIHEDRHASPNLELNRDQWHPLKNLYEPPLTYDEDGHRMVLGLSMGLEFEGLTPEQEKQAWEKQRKEQQEKMEYWKKIPEQVSVRIFKNTPTTEDAVKFLKDWQVWNTLAPLFTSQPFPPSTEWQLRITTWLQYLGKLPTP